ncbi:MAG: chlorite dismutase family protein [Gemmatimonadaceae bacterium]
MSDTATEAHPPETVEGWYALHQIYRSASPEEAHAKLSATETSEQVSGRGWSRWVRLIGSAQDLMLIHFRPTLDDLAEAQDASRHWIRSLGFELVFSFLSVTEAGLYHITAQLAANASARGGAVGDDEYRAEMSERVRSELESDHVKRRLYPQPPADMPYVCFYPMSKRRAEGQNWYALSLAERSRLMHAHGLTGRKYAGRIQQIICGAIGLDAWEWGVTLFARDPLDFKRIVTEMRFDEVSANYADFGDFYVGKILTTAPV